MGNVNERASSTSELSLHQFRLLRVVGKGAFGKVRIVQRKDTGATYALKYIRKDSVVRAESIRNILRERRMLEVLNHPFIVNLRYGFQDVEYIYLVVDLMTGGDLRFHISRKNFAEDAVKFWIAELACALRYVHKHGFVHRDVKPDNILLDLEGHVHLADFNVAAEWSKDKPLTSQSGTMSYLAPEALQGRPYGPEVDWWALGVVMYECIFGRRPFEDRSSEAFKQKVRNGNPNYYICDPPISDNCLATLRRLLEKDPKKRIGAKSFKSFAHSPMFMFIDFTALERREVEPVFRPSMEKANFDATYDLEELLLEQSPLETRRQKPRPKLKDGASTEEVRTERLHKAIERLFDPFDYTDSMTEDEKDLEFFKLSGRNRRAAAAAAAEELKPTPTKSYENAALSKARRLSQWRACRVHSVTLSEHEQKVYERRGLPACFRPFAATGPRPRTAAAVVPASNFQYPSSIDPPSRFLLPSSLQIRPQSQPQSHIELHRDERATACIRPQKKPDFSLDDLAASLDDVSPEDYYSSGSDYTPRASLDNPTFALKRKKGIKTSGSGYNGQGSSAYSELLRPPAPPLPRTSTSASAFALAVTSVDHASNSASTPGTRAATPPSPENHMGHRLHLTPSATDAATYGYTITHDPENTEAGSPIANNNSNNKRTIFKAAVMPWKHALERHKAREADKTLAKLRKNRGVLGPLGSRKLLEIVDLPGYKISVEDKTSKNKGL